MAIEPAFVPVGRDAQYFLFNGESAQQFALFLTQLNARLGSIGYLSIIGERGVIIVVAKLLLLLLTQAPTSDERSPLPQDMKMMMSTKKESITLNVYLMWFLTCKEGLAISLEIQLLLIIAL